MPICGRCAEYGSECQYVKSRRGYKGPNKRARTDEDDGSADGANDEDIQSQSSGPQENPTAAWLAGTGPEQGAVTIAKSVNPAFTGDTLIQANQIKANSSDALVDTYYTRFHAAHPVALPRKMFIKNPQLVPDYLKAIMRLIGSRYVSGFARDALHRESCQVLQVNVPDSGFKVQGLLLLAMHSFACLDQDTGNAALGGAIDTALRIGMNRSDFPPDGEIQDPVIKESWRRTWWELYVVAALISALYASDQHASKILIAEISTSLPGSCEEYNACRPLNILRNLNEMQDRAFIDDGYDYSSFAYKVEAARILYSALQLGRDHFVISDSEIDAVDASLANFLVSLPATKRSVVHRSGLVDETLFFAYMINHFTSIIVHRPRSGLAFIRNHYPTVCTKVQMAAVGGLEYESHTTKALQAANAVSNLAALRTPLANHTPCFSCSIAAAATVQLPAYLIEDSNPSAQGLKERLQLALGALNSIADVWPMASVVRSQLLNFARETFIRPSQSPQAENMSAAIFPPAAVAAAPEVSAVTNEHIRILDELFQEDGSGIDGTSLWPDVPGLGGVAVQIETMGYAR